MRQVKQMVDVWGKKFEVVITQQSKTVWIASGEYLGESHSTKDRSANSAAMRWQEWARTKGG